MTACTPAAPTQTTRTLARPIALMLLGLAVVAACTNLIITHNPSDLDVYRAGGRAVLDGRPLYDVRLHGLGFTYPPFAGLLFTGLSWLPRSAAIITLSAATLTALALLLRRAAPAWARGVATRPKLGETVGVLVLIASEPVRSTLRFGQVDVLLTALVLFDLTGRRSRCRGCGVGLAAAIKLTPGIFVVYLLLRRRYREAANSAAVFSAVTFAALVVLPSDSVQFWFRDVIAGSGIGSFSSPNNNSLNGLLRRTWGPRSADIAWPPLAIVCGVIGLALALCASKAGAEILAIGAVGVTGCVISPVSWDHHWTWCIPLLIGAASATRHASWQVRAALLCSAAVFGGRDLVPKKLFGEFGLGAWLVPNAFVLAAGGFACVGFVLHRGRMRSSTPG